MYIFFCLMVLWAIFDIFRGYRKAKNKQGYLVKTLVGTAVVIVILFLFGPFFMISPIKIGYTSLADSEVAVFYPSSHTAQGAQIFEMAQQAFQKNKDFYGQADHTKVLVATSNLDMLRFGVYPQGNGGGLIWGIVIRESKASWNIIAHEMSHKNLSKLSPVASSIFSFPRWFDEGLASYIGSMDWYKKPDELAHDLQRGTYLREITQWKSIGGNLTWLSQTFFKKNSQLIYGQTYLMVKYLFDTYGQEKVYQLVQQTPASSFDQVFKQVFGLTIDEFHQQFINFIEK